MPGLDGTGPRGLGSMTGGRRGFCAGFIGYPQMPLSPPMYSPLMQQQNTLPNPFQFRTPIAAPPTMPMAPAAPNPFGYNVSAEEEIKMLGDQVVVLKRQLEDMRRRIAELGR